MDQVLEMRWCYQPEPRRFLLVYIFYVCTYTKCASVSVIREKTPKLTVGYFSNMFV